jgi:hypothetical protein
VLTAFTVTTYTVVSTSEARPVTTTVTQYTTVHTAEQSSIADSTTVYSTSTVIVSPIPVPSDAPIGYNYSCPADNNTTQTVVIGTQLYSYHIFCNSSFANETAFSITSATSEGDCIALCSAADNLAQGPLCKGFSFDGVSCGLYTQALTSDLTSSLGIDSAVLAIVRGSNTTFATRTAGTSQLSSLAASITRGTTLITPPPQFIANSTGYSSCFTSTYTDVSDGLVHWTESCSSSSSWYEAFASSATIIYSSETILIGEGSGSNGAGGGAGGGVVSSPGAIVISVTTTSTAVSGAVTGGAGNGGVIQTESTITTIFQGSTITYISTLAASGSGNGPNATGGASDVISTSTALSGVTGGGTGTGGVILPSFSTVTTIIEGSTSVYITTFATSGSGGGNSGTGGIVPVSSPWNLSTTWFISGGSTVVTSTSKVTSGDTSGSSGTGGILPNSANITSTIINATTTTTVQSSATSGETSGGSGTGGVLPTSSNFTVTSINATTITIPGWNYSSPLATDTTPSTTPSLETTPGLPNSGLPGPSSNHSWTGTTTERPRSGQQTPGSPSSGFPFPSPNSTWLSETLPGLPSTPTGLGYPPPLNYTTPPVGTLPTTDTGTLNFPIPTSNHSWTGTTTERPRSGQQFPSGLSSGFPLPSPNSTWLGETHPAPVTTATGILIPGSSTNATTTSTYCATTTVRETVTQTIYISGVCTSTPYAGFPWGGYGPFGGGGSSPLSTSVSSSSTAPSPSPISADQLRRENERATPAQIDSSCKNIGNQIFNGEFELVDSNSSPLGWGFATGSMQIMFMAFEDDSQITPSGSWEGRIVSLDPSAVGRILQPLTLCPNTTYSFSGWTRQARVLAECSATFSISGSTIGSVSPGQVYGSGISNLKDYTADTAEVDFEISVQCIGSGDRNNTRTIDFDDLSLIVKSV